MLHLETIESNTLELLRKLQSLYIFKNSRLVGGTALALQLGHRKSVDLDLFGTIEITPEEIQEVCRKAGELEISKVSRNINRGTKKDFIDLYFLLQEMSLNHILDLYDQKYPDGSRFIAIKSLTYFEDAESDPMPYMFSDITWEEVKVSIIDEVRKL